MDILTMLAELADLQDEQAALLAAQADAIPHKLRTELTRIAKRFAPDVEKIRTELELLTLQLKAAVIEHGASVKGERLQAVYVSGKAAWNNDALIGYAVTHAEILAFRREGKPSVSLRRVSV